MAASQDATINLTELLTRSLTDRTVQARVETALQRSRPELAIIREAPELDEVAISTNAIAALLLTHVNGTSDLPEQNVVVEYLKNDQRLVIPAAMGMGLYAASDSRCVGNAVLRSRYLKVSTMSYTQVAAAVAGDRSPTQVRTDIDALPEPLPLLQQYAAAWDDEAWYATQAAGIVEQPHAALVFSILSHYLQFNCDIRDYGYLNKAGSTIGDADWMNIAACTVERLKNKLRPYSLQCIAALNYTGVASYPLAAWARAYGLGVGIMPTANSRGVSEVIYSARMPAQAERDAVVNFESNFQSPMYPVCCNILAMFGLFHLNKDHTYRTGDQNMERIGKSYINTLRTIVDQGVIESMLTNKEAVVRTAAHPFGLAQTYWLAKAMHKFGKLTSPLAIRHNTSPPPVQRLMVVNAATIEWGALPAGVQLSLMYQAELEVIRAAVKEVEANPVAYSGLHHLYGINEQRKLTAAQNTAVAALLPVIYGYAMATHVTEQQERDGLALALSLRNLERDQKGVITMWKNSWDKYVHDIDEGGLLEFMRQTAILQGRAIPEEPR